MFKKRKRKGMGKCAADERVIGMENLKNNYTMGSLPKRPYHINQMKNVRELYQVLNEQEKLDIPYSEDLSWLHRSHRIGNKVIPNSLAVHPCEGFDGTREGNPSESVFRRYKRYAEGGSGLIWFESFAVTIDGKDGKDGPNQLMIEKDNIKSVSKLIKATDEAAMNRYGSDHRPYKVIQISHSGRRSVDENWYPMPVTGGKNPVYDDSQRGKTIIASDEYIEKMVEKYIQSAENAMEAGFDGVDMKICHSYILSDLMGAFTRTGKYGGSFENRTRAILEIVDGIRTRCGDRLDICVRMNAYDAIPYPYGWGMVQEEGVMAPDLNEPKKLLRILADKGVKMANISTGASRYLPFGEGLYVQGSGSEVNPYPGVHYLLKTTKELREAVPELLYVGTGLSWFEKFCGNVSAGCMEQGWFDIAGFGRQALAYPDYARDLLTVGVLNRKKLCVLCDKCHELHMIGHTHVGCVMRDQEYYLPLYRKKVMGN